MGESLPTATLMEQAVSVTASTLLLEGFKEGLNHHHPSQQPSVEFQHWVERPFQSQDPGHQMDAAGLSFDLVSALREVE